MVYYHKENYKNLLKVGKINIHNVQIGDTITYANNDKERSNITIGKVIFIDQKGYFFTIDTDKYKTSIHFLDKNYRIIKKNSEKGRKKGIS